MLITRGIALNFVVRSFPPDRLQNLKNTFETKFGESPQFYAYAPGRVNLIGNYFHTNYPELSKMCSYLRILTCN